MSSGVNKRRRRPEDEDEEEEEGAGVDGYKSESEGSLSGEAEDEEEEENADSSSEFDPDLVCLVNLFYIHYSTSIHNKTNCLMFVVTLSTGYSWSGDKLGVGLCVGTVPLALLHFVQ